MTMTTMTMTMTINDLKPETIKEAIREFYDVASRHVTWMAKKVGNENTTIPRSPRKLGTFQFPYFFAADIDQLARFAMGGLQASSQFVLGHCETIERVLFSAPAGGSVPFPADWHEKGVGGIVSIARARCALRREPGEPLTAAQVHALTCLSEEDLRAGGLLAEGGDAPAAVRDFMEKSELPI